MPDHATPNLPSRNFDNTIEFYSKLGFETRWRDASWLIIDRGSLCLEFFLYPDLDPSTSSFSCCLRLDDINQFYGMCVDADVTEQSTGWPRIHKPKLEHSGMTIGYLIDIDGTLLRLVQNRK